MKHLTGAVVAALVALTLGVAPGQDKKDGDDKAKFQGTWQYKSVAVGEVKKDFEEKLTFTVTGDRYVIKLNDEVIQEGTQKLNPAGKPPEIDMKVEKGMDAGDILAPGS